MGCIGRGSRIRTCDLLVPNQTRYQTALCPAGDGVRYMLRICPASKALVGFKYGGRHPIARNNSELSARSTDNLQNSPDRPPRGYQPCRQWLGIFCNSQNASIGADEKHVERNVSILHPEADVLLAMEVEQHSAAFRQFLAVHKSFFSFGVIIGDLDRKHMHASFAGDLNCLLTGRPTRAARDEQTEQDKGDTAKSTHVLAFTRLKPQRQSKKLA